MKNCPNCHNQAKDDALYCPVCGTTLDTFPQPDAQCFGREAEPAKMPVYIPPAPVPDAHDRTEDFDTDDIAENKLTCMIVYLLDFAGVIIALLMSGSSGYTRFHVRQSLRFTVLEALLSLVSVLLCWTFLVPIIGLIGLIILMVIKIICFIDVCNGKAKDAPILRSIKFLN